MDADPVERPAPAGEPAVLDRPLPGLAIPLADDLLVFAAHGAEAVVELGAVPVRGADRRGVTVVMHLVRTDGRGTWTPGLWWPDEPAATWAGTERRLEPDAVALPVVPDADGVDRQVRVLLRLRPRGTGRRCGAVVRAEVRFPLGTGVGSW